MNLKETIKLLKTIDGLPSIKDVLVEYEGRMLPSSEMLFNINGHLADELMYLEITSPSIFLSGYEFISSARKELEKNGIRVVSSSGMYKYYLELENMSFGIGFN